MTKTVRNPEWDLERRISDVRLPSKIVTGKSQTLKYRADGDLISVKNTTAKSLGHGNMSDWRHISVELKGDSYVVRPRRCYCTMTVAPIWTRL
jgi:hypothetical protein